ncbi:phenylacetate--CoA ligase family protein [bacterium]|nr:phenylacetate--CoA ligase family protein [bacterium]
MAWGNVPIGEIRERQGRKLHQFISNKVYPFCPHYRRLMDEAGLGPDSIRNLEDLRRLPFSSKADIASTEDNPARFRDFIIQPDEAQLKASLSLFDKIGLAARSRREGKSIKDLVLDEYLPVMTTFTTGRTALPTPFVYTKADMQQLRLAGARMFEVSGFDRKRDRIVSVMPFAPHLGFWQISEMGFETGVMVMHTGGGKVMGSQGILAVIGRIKPTVLIGTPGYVMHLVHLAEQLGTSMEQIRIVVLGAERVPPMYKLKLKERLAKLGAQNVRVLVTYGMTEAKKAWLESDDSEDSRYLTYPDMEIFEIVDPGTGEPVPEGSPGEIVYSHISGAGSTVLRYRTGDLVKEGLVYGQCPHTGKQLPLLGTSITRVSEIKKVKGTLVDFNELFNLFNAERDIIEWQMVVSKPEGNEFGQDQVQLLVALHEGCSQPDFEKAIQTKFRIQTEIGIDEIRFYSHEEMSSELGMETMSKEKRIVDRRP